MKLNKILIGCCGFCTSRAEYYNNFNCLEVQKTFYQPPEFKTLKKWYDESPDNFVFTLKAWQLITHTPKSPTYKKLKLKIPDNKKHLYGNFIPSDEVFQAWEITAECAKILHSPIVIFQTPSSFTPENNNIENMREFFKRIDRHDIMLGWEPRGRQWDYKTIKKLCKELNLIDVVDPFKRKPEWGEIFYFRLHGIGGYRYKYTDDDLNSLLEKIPLNKRGYIMFNNVYMCEDAKRFKVFIEKKSKC